MSASLSQKFPQRSAPNRAEFAPPKPPGMLRAVGLALVAHTLLLLALTWGVHWKQQPDIGLAVEAELWSSVPQQAAPAPMDEPPPPPQPEPPMKAQPRPEPPDTRDADIALARQRKAEERKLEERREAEAARQADDEKKRLAKLQDDKRRKELARQDAARAAQDAIEREVRRLDNLRRMTGMAGATGSDNGNATRSAGPSAGYGNRIRARIKPNIVFADDIAGNPTAEVEVRLAPDGMIIARRIVKSSGVKDWDEAVLKAIDKTEMLPKDTDGRVPQDMLISFRPKD